MAKVKVNPEGGISVDLLVFVDFGTHIGAMLFTAGGVALLVYYRLGVAILRQTWFNLDQVCAIVLIVAGVLAAVL